MDYDISHECAYYSDCKSAFNDPEQTVEDTLCSIRFGGETQDNNEIITIIFCDKCDAAVHLRCHEVNAVSRSSWYCDSCSTGRDSSSLQWDLFSNATGTNDDELRGSLECQSNSDASLPSGSCMSHTSIIPLQSNSKNHRRQFKRMFFDDDDDGEGGHDNTQRDNEKSGSSVSSWPRTVHDSMNEIPLMVIAGSHTNKTLRTRLPVTETSNRGQITSQREMLTSRHQKGEKFNVDYKNLSSIKALIKQNALTVKVDPTFTQEDLQNALKQARRPSEAKVRFIFPTGVIQSKGTSDVFREWISTRHMTGTNVTQEDEDDAGEEDDSASPLATASSTRSPVGSPVREHHFNVSTAHASEPRIPLGKYQVDYRSLVSIKAALVRHAPEFTVFNSFTQSDLEGSVKALRRPCDVRIPFLNNESKGTFSCRLRNVLSGRSSRTRRLIDPFDHTQAADLQVAGPFDHTQAADLSDHTQAAGPFDHTQAADLSDHTQAAGPFDHAQAADLSDHAHTADLSGNEREDETTSRDKEQNGRFDVDFRSLHSIEAAMKMHLPSLKIAVSFTQENLDSALAQSASPSAVELPVVNAEGSVKTLPIYGVLEGAIRHDTTKEGIGKYGIDHTLWSSIVVGLRRYAPEIRVDPSFTQMDLNNAIEVADKPSHALIRLVDDDGSIKQTRVHSAIVANERALRSGGRSSGSSSNKNNSNRRSSTGSSRSDSTGAYTSININTSSSSNDNSSSVRVRRSSRVHSSMNSDSVPINCVMCPAKRTREAEELLCLHPYVPRSSPTCAIGLCVSCLLRWRSHRDDAELHQRLIVHGVEALCCVCSDDCTLDTDFISCDVCPRSYCKRCLDGGTTPNEGNNACNGGGSGLTCMCCVLGISSTPVAPSNVEEVGWYPQELTRIQIMTPRESLVGIDDSTPRESVEHTHSSTLTESLVGIDGSTLRGSVGGIISSAFPSANHARRDRGSRNIWSSNTSGTNSTIDISTNDCTGIVGNTISIAWSESIDDKTMVSPPFSGGAGAASLEEGEKITVTLLSSTPRAPKGATNLQLKRPSTPEEDVYSNHQCHLDEDLDNHRIKSCRFDSGGSSGSSISDSDSDGNTAAVNSSITCSLDDTASLQSQRAVNCFSFKTLALIRTFPSAKDAALYLLTQGHHMDTTHATEILRCCRLDIGCAYGYCWRFVE